MRKLNIKTEEGMREIIAACLPKEEAEEIPAIKIKSIPKIMEYPEPPGDE